MSLKIMFFTAGCPRSQITGKNLQKAAKLLGLDADIEMIDDPKIHQEQGVSAFPAIKIEGEVKTEGEFRTVDDCREILEPYCK